MAKLFHVGIFDTKYHAMRRLDVLTACAHSCLPHPPPYFNVEIPNAAHHLEAKNYCPTLKMGEGGQSDLHVSMFAFFDRFFHKICFVLPTILSSGV